MADFLGNFGSVGGPFAVGGATLMGMWFVIRLVIHFQKDFTDRYSSELEREIGRRERAEETAETLRAAVDKQRQGADHDLANAYAQIRRLTKAMNEAGLEPPSHEQDI